MKKKLLTIFLMVMTLILGINSASAETVTITRITDEILTYDPSKLLVLSVATGTNHTGYPRMPYKHVNSVPFLCISGLDVSAKNGSICTYDATLQLDKAIGMAYIIKAFDSSTLDQYNKYYWQEIAIQKYLGKFDVMQGENITDAEHEKILANIEKLLNDTTLIGTGKSINQIISEATSYQSKYGVAAYNKAVEIQFSDSSLKFTLSGNNYVSQKIYITDVNGNMDESSITRGGDTSLYTLNQGTENGKKYFQVVIPKTNTLEKKVSVEILVSGSYLYNRAMVYDCENDGTETVQDLVSTKLITLSRNDTQKITGSFSSGKLTVKKVDENGNLIAGAKLKIESKENNYSNTITTGTTETVLNYLALGKYTVTEVEAPEGYIKSSEVKTVELTDAKLSLSVAITNKINKIVISKLNLANSKLLPGATLEIQDKDGNVVNYCIDDKGNKNTACRWVSTDVPYEVEAFPNGTYYLVEISSPDGFLLNTEKVEFTVDGSLEIVPVKMENKPTKVVISKISSDTGKLLAGAKLKIEDKSGKTLYEWESTDKVYELNGLSYGTYYLVEVSAPNGYELNKEKYEFVVDATTPVVEVTMENDKDFDVPNTLSGRSSLLMAFAMFDIALGVGIIIYVKKNKVTE